MSLIFIASELHLCMYTSYYIKFIMRLFQNHIRKSNYEIYCQGRVKDLQESQTPPLYYYPSPAGKRNVKEGYPNQHILKIS